jgi:hypothetical protein
VDDETSEDGFSDLARYELRSGDHLTAELTTPAIQPESVRSTATVADSPPANGPHPSSAFATGEVTPAQRAGASRDVQGNLGLTPVGLAYLGLLSTMVVAIMVVRPWRLW